VIEPRLIQDRRGVSLPLVILMMALLALAVTAGFSRVSEERRIVGDQQAQVDAFAVAQSGLERYAALMDSQPVPNDSIAIPIGPRDTAHVVLLEIRPPNGATPSLYVVRSRGVSHGAPRYSVNTPPAQRTVAQYATWGAVSMDVKAAWTAIPGLRSESGNGTMNGNDACATAPSVAGVAVPVLAQSGLAGFSAPPSPTPPVRWLGPLPANAQDSVRIDWNAIVSGPVLQPDYTLTSETGWPFFTPLQWPVIRVDGNATLDGGESGQGLIVVTGNLTITPGFTWDGVILVGEVLTVSGNGPLVRGAIVSGLNVKLGASVSDSRSGLTPGVDQIDLQYDSCKVAAALARYGHLTLIANAWTDSWPEN
jgi:hypothetical protein